MGNFVTLRLFLFFFSVEWITNRRVLVTVLNFSPYSNSCAGIRCLRIFDADRQKGIRKKKEREREAGGITGMKHPLKSDQLSF